MGNSLVTEFDALKSSLRPHSRLKPDILMEGPFWAPFSRANIGAVSGIDKCSSNHTDLAVFGQTMLLA